MIYLLCSTIRPKTFIQTHHDWMARSDNPNIIKTKIIVDTTADATILKNYDVSIYEQENNGITKPLTRLTQSLKGLKDDDIIVVMSDDFHPPAHWDSFLTQCFNEYSGALSVYDGGVPEVQKTIITIPIMDYATLKRLNKIVYHPAYTHMYSDNELYDNLVELKKLKIIDPSLGYTFEHRHWTKGTRPKDAQDLNLEKIALTEDVHIYNKRKKLSLKNRLKYTPEIKPLLSILICSLDDRSFMLNRLLNCVQQQIDKENANDIVEILVETDNRKITIGAKRNKLLKRSKGMYVAFIDDDDLVSTDYIKFIIMAAKYKLDCIGIEGIITINGVSPKKFIHSINNGQQWREDKGIYLRPPNHCNPIKRNIALKVGFNPNKSFEEDKEFSVNIFKYLRTEIHIPIPIYGYIFTTEIKEYLQK